MRLGRKKFVLIMLDKNITQKKLSEISGVSRATICSIKSGKSCSVETAQKIAEALNVDLTEIIE